jgi:hypothetical protein
MKRAQLTNFEESRRSAGRQLVVQPCGFGRLDGSKSKAELERANGWLVGAESGSATSRPQQRRRAGAGPIDDAQFHDRDRQ